MICPLVEFPCRTHITPTLLDSEFPTAGSYPGSHTYGEAALEKVGWGGVGWGGVGCPVPGGRENVGR